MTREEPVLIPQMERKKLRDPGPHQLFKLLTEVSQEQEAWRKAWFPQSILHVLESMHTLHDILLPVSPDTGIRYSHAWVWTDRPSWNPVFQNLTRWDKEFTKGTTLPWNKHPFCPPTPQVSGVAHYAVRQMLSCVYMNSCCYCRILTMSGTSWWTIRILFPGDNWVCNSLRCKGDHNGACHAT